MLGDDRKARNELASSCVGSLVMFGHVHNVPIPPVQVEERVDIRGESRASARIAGTPVFFQAADLNDPKAAQEEAFWSGLCEGRTDRALFLLAGDGMVVRFNAVAQAMVAQGDIFSVLRGHLTCNDPADHNKLRSILSSFVNDDQVAGALRLDSRLMATVDRVTPPFSDRTASTFHVLLVVYVPPEFNEGILERWRSMFGFTPQEARVAELMRRGLDDNELATLLDVSLATVRTHVRQIYAKAGTRNRAEIAHLLSRVDIF